MTLKHLKIFVEVCECGSVTAAAEKLYIAQPAASHAIGELERYYGIKLFDRIARRLHITEAGRQFLQYATHIVGLFEELETRARNFDAAGVLRVGTSITIGNCLLPDYAVEFQKRHPQMELRAVIENSEAIERMVMQNEIDLGLIEGEVHSDFLVSTQFREDRLVLLCGRDHPWTRRESISPEELAESALILRERGSAGREILDGILQARGLQARPAWQSASTQAIVRAVARGLGVSVLPYLLVKENLERGELCQVEVEGVSFARSFSVIHHKNKFLTHSARDFISICR